MPTTQTFPRCQLNRIDGRVLLRKGGLLLMPCSDVIIYYMAVCACVCKKSGLTFRLLAVWTLHRTWSTRAAATLSHGARLDWRAARTPCHFKRVLRGSITIVSPSMRLNHSRIQFPFHSRKNGTQWKAIR